MFSKQEPYNKNIFVNTIKVDKTKESKTTPHVSAKHLTLSAYDRVVQIVTNNDNNEIKPEEEANKNTYDYLDNYLSLFVCLKFNAFKLIRTCFIVSLCVKYYVINSCCIGCNPYFTIYNITIR